VTDAAWTAAVEVAARAAFAAEWEGDFDTASEIEREMARQIARAALSALLAARLPEEACETCGGAERIAGQTPHGNAIWVPCPAGCSNGKVPGRPLVVFADELEQVGWWGALVGWPESQHVLTVKDTACTFQSQEPVFRLPREVSPAPQDTP
jgi:hypothetical protein